MDAGTPRSGLEYFVDRSLGRRKVPSALRGAGRTVHVHDDHFAPDAEDTVWLPEVARRGWVILTKDRSIGRKRNELAAIKLVGARVFALTAAQITAAEATERFVAALDQIERIVASTPGPFSPASAVPAFRWSSCDVGVVRHPAAGLTASADRGRLPGVALSVFVTHPPVGDFDSELRAALTADVRLTYGPALPAPPDYAVLVAGRPTAEQLDASSALRAIIVPYVGVAPATREALRARPHLTLHNLHHNAAPTAEMAVTLLLAAAKRVVPLDQDLRRGAWPPPLNPSGALLLEGRTALVLGLGAIGRRVARALRALGMKVLATRRRADGLDPDCDELHSDTALDALLPRADALVICLPETDDTTGLLDAARLARLPRGAVLVNVGRGAIVDEQALYAALRDGHVGAAGLDVWWRYPERTGARDAPDDPDRRAATLPATAPFHELPNVVLSPHRGGLTDGTERLRAHALARLLDQAARGEPIENRVDVARGY